MTSLFLSILSIYLFIGVGFLAKSVFKEKLDNKTLTLLSVYFLQIFLTLWGLLQQPLNQTILITPVIYLFVVVLLFLLLLPISKLLFKDAKERSIAGIAAFVGNTGNLGIPLGIAIFGEESIPYTTLINLVNLFFVYTLGVYIYSRGSFDIKTSLINIVKIPILWAALLAIGLNFFGFFPGEKIEQTLKMGAYAAIVVQLLLFGIYLYDAKIRELNRYLFAWVSSIKFLIIPIVAFMLLLYIDIAPMIKGIILMELMMPLAVANINFASLYECRPNELATLVFLTSLLFLGIVFVFIEIIKFF